MYHGWTDLNRIAAWQFLWVQKSDDNDRHFKCRQDLSAMDDDEYAKYQFCKIAALYMDGISIILVSHGLHSKYLNMAINFQKRDRKWSINAFA